MARSWPTFAHIIEKLKNQRISKIAIFSRINEFYKNAQIFQFFLAQNTLNFLTKKCKILKNFSGRRQRLSKRPASRKYIEVFVQNFQNLHDSALTASPAVPHESLKFQGEITPKNF